MSAETEALPPGSALLANHDRWGDTRALDVTTLQLTPLGRDRTESDHLNGWFVIRHGRPQALLRWDDCLHYLSGDQLWDVDRAVVHRLVVGPLRRLRFEHEGTTIGICRWLDSEFAQRRFIPKRLDVLRYEDDAEDFDWSLFIEAVFSSDRRHRIGRSI